jgi:16S rRNA (guanine(527)-N(7))-methyltransferase RsmG
MSFPEQLRARALERGIRLGPSELAALGAHHRLLRHWNRTAHLTSVLDDDEIIDRHFLESLEALPFIEEDRAGTLVDVGTGNGFPSLPLLVHRPRARGILLEPTTRKRAFLKEVIRELGVADRIQVHPDRIDKPADLLRHGPFQWLTMRAVGKALESVLAGAAEGLELGGRALLFLGSAGLDRASAGADGLALEETVPLHGRDASFLAVLRRT